jgi:uncharacterized membrane protein
MPCPPGGLLRVDVRVGSFVYSGRRLCTAWVTGPADDETLDDLDGQIHEAFALGRARTMQQDVAFGMRQLVDVALRALSTGVNDATTAYECIVHLGEVLYEILRRDLPPAVRHGEDGRRLLRPQEFTHEEYVERAFDQIRRNAAAMPDLCVALVRTLGNVAAELDDRSLGRRVPPLARQARLVLAGATAEHPLPEDLDVLRQSVLDAGFRPLPPSPVPAR